MLPTIRRSFVSRESAERDYGVVLTADARAVDLEATQARRVQRPATKLFHRHGYHAALD